MRPLNLRGYVNDEGGKGRTITKEQRMKDRKYNCCEDIVYA